MNGAPFIELRNVSKNYQLGDIQVTALKKVSLSIEYGAYLAVVGPSGSGKTTLLNLLTCLDTPSSGEILFSGSSTTNLTGNRLADFRLHSIGIIFQSFNLIPVLDVMENVEYPLLLQNVPKKERLSRVNHLLELVGLESRRHHRPDELSGGQRQRVGIARALITKPKLVIADEPTANLDSHTAMNIIELMSRLNREEGTTFIFSTHDGNIINSVSRVIRIKDGELCS